MAVTREVEAVIARHRTADNKRKGGYGKGSSGGSGQDLDDTGDGFTYGSDLHDVIQGGYIDEDQGEDGGVEDMIVELGADRLNLTNFNIKSDCLKSKISIFKKVR